MAQIELVYISQEYVHLRVTLAGTTEYKVLCLGDTLEIPLAVRTQEKETS